MKQFKTESKRILDLMINSIYTNKDIFLRELISNASDAIDKLKFKSLTDGNVKSDFTIKLTPDNENKTLTVSDNGIGMTDIELEKNLGTIAQSGTLSFKSENKEDLSENLIGQFGVGFYSAFMVADKITVISKAFGADSAFKWESKGAAGYEISPCEKDGVGTDIILTLKEDTEDVKYSEYLDEYKLRSLIKEYSDYIRYPITMEVTKTKIKEGSPEDKPEYETKREIETLNSMVPIWKKPKAEVTEENLEDFYRSEFHDFNKPLKSIYSKIEGMVNYDTLLYIPAKAPYDYYSKNYKKGVKLYCNGVMIMEKCEDLIPDYFAFMRGIVDSSDLNLNISREILQQDRQVKAIATSLEKKIIAELKKTLESDRETYEKIFTEFGLSIKFGVYDNFGLKKDALKDLLMFYSSKKQKLVTLSEYVKEMPEGQTEIYYACGEDYDKIDKMPQIEKAKDGGYEILYFKDNVDEFVTKILGEFEGKKFKAVTDADFSTATEEEKKELENKNAENKGLLDFIKETLGEKVKEVRFSSKLKTYPVCLTAGGEISIEMEKVLNSMPNSENKISAEKILELNSEHKVTEKLIKLYNDDRETLKKYAVVLYEQARLLEGLPIEDVSAFVMGLSEII